MKKHDYTKGSTITVVSQDVTPPPTTIRVVDVTPPAPPPTTIGVLVTSTPPETVRIPVCYTEEPTRWAGARSERTRKPILSKRIIAYHEAGHAAVHLYFEHDIELVTIVRDGDAGGSVTHNRADHDALRYEDELQKQVPFERAIMAALAGEIAQRRFAPDSVDDIHAATDRHLVHEYLDELDTPTQEVRDAYWQLLELRTKALVERLWPRIEGLADALLERKTMTGAEAEAVFKGPRYLSIA